jgi:peptidyl-prolyl cis-trans isomerase SurA
MTWSGRAFGVCAVLLAAGCAQTVPPEVLPTSRDTPFLLQAQDVESTVGARTSRSQQPDQLPNLPPAPPPANTVAQASAVPPMAGQPPPPPLPATTPDLPGAPPESGIQQVSMVSPAKMRFGVSVRAWVNGKPIFEDEIRCSMPSQMVVAALRLPPDQRDAELARIIRLVTDGLIDQELLVQDMMKKIEKQPKVVEKYKSAATKECQKRIFAQLRANKLNTIPELEERLAEGGSSLESIKRVIEREFLSGIYVRGRIDGPLQRVGNDEIRDYYNQHQNQFVQPDKVKWQNIFIAVGPKHPTLADARTFAEQVMANWRSGTEVSTLLEFDDGESQARKGDGAGELRGDIRPRELEPLLFAMQDGEFGPLYELPTGVHLYRLVHRDNAGFLPLDEKLQTQIGNMLKNEIFDKEKKRLIRELRDLAGERVVIVDLMPPGQ